MIINVIKEDKSESLAPNLPTGEEIADNFLSDILFTNENLNFAFKANMVSLGYLAARGGFNLLRRRFVQGAASVGICSLFGPIAGGICGTVAGMAGMALAAYDIYYIYDEIEGKKVPVKKAIGFDSVHNDLRRLANERITNNTDFQRELAIRTARNSMRSSGKGMPQFMQGDNSRRYKAFAENRSPVMWVPPSDPNHCGTKLVGRPGTSFGEKVIEIKTSASTWGFDEDNPETLRELFKGDISNIVWPTIKKKNSECASSQKFANRIANDYKTALEQWLRMGAPQGGLSKLKSAEDQMKQKEFANLITSQNGCVPQPEFDENGYNVYFDDQDQAKVNLRFVAYALKKLTNEKGVPYVNQDVSDSQCSVEIVTGIKNFQTDNRGAVQHYYREKLVSVTGMANKYTIMAMIDKLGISQGDPILQGVMY